MRDLGQPIIHLTAHTSSFNSEVKYNRQLWLEQAFPDNYTDDTFLQSLTVNVRTPARSYWQVVREAAAVTQQMDTVVAVATVSVYLYKASVSTA